jgi:methionyl-tRNA formyltransferase
MGTPDFAVPTLEALHSSGNEIVLVVTRPDKPKGRGRKLGPPPVKKAASPLGCPVLQPPSLRDEATQQTLRDASADFFIVVAYGQILTEKVLSMPRQACINVHASLLPKYRGPAPIHWAVINGENETGVTTMLMDKGLDTGDLLMTVREKISALDTAGSLHERLAKLGADLLIRTLDAFAEGTTRRTPQDHSLATYAPLLKKTDGLIDWKKAATQIEPFVRGMSPWPGAFTFWGSHRLKVFRAEIAARTTSAPPGTVLDGFSDELVVAAGDGALSILELQGASGNRLPVDQFLRGCRIPAGDLLS